MNWRKTLSVAFGFASLLFTAANGLAISPDVVISQVYGGGGNSGATYKNDFIELFNRSNTPVSLTGWSVQYTSAAGTSTWLVTSLNGSIAPHGYFLIQLAAGSGGTVALPTPDAVGTTNMSGTAGKLALLRVTTALTGATPASPDIVDLVGYGPTASAFETAPTAATTNTTAAVRKLDGCTETDNNNTDFAISAPTPRNSASPANPCAPVLLDAVATWLDATTLKIDATLSAAGTVKLETSTDLASWTPGSGRRRSGRPGVADRHHFRRPQVFPARSVSVAFSGAGPIAFCCCGRGFRPQCRPVWNRA